MHTDIYRKSVRNEAWQKWHAIFSILGETGGILHLFPLSKRLLIPSTLPCHSHLPILYSACLHLFPEDTVFSLLQQTEKFSPLTCPHPSSPPLTFSSSFLNSIIPLSLFTKFWKQRSRKCQQTRRKHSSFHGFFCFGSLEF